MSKKWKRFLCLALAACMMLSVAVILSSCKKTNDNPSESGTNGSDDDPSTPAKSYTFNDYTSALGTNWNPHTWETNADNALLDYVSSPFCTMSIKDSENGVYQWIYEMATSITDVTKDHKDDLTKYKVTLPTGKTLADVTSGYVYEIKLNPNAKWETGEKITADDYIYSMKMLLDSTMRNYRSNLYWSGESAVAGGLAYYNSEAPIYEPMVPPYGDDEDPDYSYDLDAGIAKGEVYISVSSTEMTLYSLSLNGFHSDYGVIAEEDLKALADGANAYGFTKVTAENKATVIRVIKAVAALFGITPKENATAEETAAYEASILELVKEALFTYTGKKGDKVDYDSTVGCYKVDDYTIRYVNANAIELNYFLTSCTSTWLVHKATYEKGFDTTGELKTTNYGTTKETTVSYGPYKIESLQKDKQIILVKNENWFGYEKKANGALISYTNFEVDGKKVEQYQATRIVIDVMTDDAAKLAFLKGELTNWSPSSNDLKNYATSDRLYKIDETYTMSFFFNTNVDALKKMDTSKGNKNSVVLSNDSFRKAMSLSIDRSKYVTATSGYKPAYALLNNLYFYDVYNNPNSMYRNTDEAMQAICNLYGVEYGEGKPYKTLKEAYASINGYNLTEAKALMKTACEELVASGLYKAGEDIVIKIAWKKGSLDSSDDTLVRMLNEFLNAAMEGSGFGKITLEAVNVEDRYKDVPKGEYAIGYGAWGGAAFYPFRNFQVYMDPTQVTGGLNEGACWDPTTEKWTLTVDGKEVTMTCQEWSNCMIGSNTYADASFEIKLEILAQLEEKFLKLYYRIPLCGTTSCFLLSYKVDYYTENYNIMYDFGGLRLMQFKYDDEEWAKFVAENKNADGQLSYE